MIRINANKLYDKNSKIAIEGTMIHEIQHAIQSIEGFEEGYTTKLNKLDYFKRLGKNEEKNNSDSNIQES